MTGGTSLLSCVPELSLQAEAVRLPADQPQGSAQLLPATVCSFTPQERAWEGLGDPWGARGAVASPCLHQTFGMQYLPFPTPQGCSLVPNHLPEGTERDSQALSSPSAGCHGCHCST